MRHLRPSLVVPVLLFATHSASADLPVDERVADEIFYQIMPISWRDGDNDAHRFGDFAGMSNSLDYLEDLGITSLWMNPIFPSPAYHGYQHGRADQINPRHGTEADFLDFVQQARGRGIDVYVDLVVYGISHDTPFFASAFGNPASAYDDWLAFTNSAGNTSYLGSTYNTWNGDSVGFIHWDLRTAAARGAVNGWSAHWLDPDGDGDPTDGIAGYRLDHVWVDYPNGPDGWGYNLDDFWIPWKQSLLEVNPDVFTFAEAADWGLYGRPLHAAHDATFAIPLMFAARDAMVSGSAAGLYAEMDKATRRMPTDSAFLFTVGNHDVDRVASVVGSTTSRMKVAASILLTQPFPPVIYYGDELGMLGRKEWSYPGDAKDIPMREPFKWNAVAGPPMSNYDELSAAAFANRYSNDNDGRSVEEQTGADGSLLEKYRQLISLRRENVALRRGAYQGIDANHSAIWSFVRWHEDQVLLVAINLGSANPLVELDLSAFDVPGGSTTPVGLLSGQSQTPITAANLAAYPVQLHAFGLRIFEVGLAPPTVPDVNGDGCVDITDLSILIASFGLCESDDEYDTRADTNGSGCVDISDLAEVLAVFGEGC